MHQSTYNDSTAYVHLNGGSKNKNILYRSVEAHAISFIFCTSLYLLVSLIDCRLHSLQLCSSKHDHAKDV